MINREEFRQGERVFRVTAAETAQTPVSELLCSNFIELGFGYQVEGMWSELLFNRSFEKSFQLTPATYDWFGGEGIVGDDWRGQDWYHSGYEHNRWYACPAEDRPPSMAPDCTFLVRKAPFYSLDIAIAEGGVHGEHCLQIHNFEQERWCGVAQNGKYLRKGAGYHFRGWFRAEGAAKAELRIYKTGPPPIGRLRLWWWSSTGLAANGRCSNAILPIRPRRLLHLLRLHRTRHDAAGRRLLIDARESVNGWRADVVEGLRRVNPKLIRFPGGCFASLYDWRRAVGPIDRRIPEPSYFWGDLNYNDVGTDEFLQLCEALGCESMLVVNMFHPGKRHFLAPAVLEPKPGGQPHGFSLDSITDIEEGIRCAAAWVEYCNGPVTSKYGAMRAANGTRSRTACSIGKWTTKPTAGSRTKNTPPRSSATPRQ